jgi:hypothetical protein
VDAGQLPLPSSVSPFASVSYRQCLLILILMVAASLLLVLVLVLLMPAAAFAMFALFGSWRRSKPCIPDTLQTHHACSIERQQQVQQAQQRVCCVCCW